MEPLNKIRSQPTAPFGYKALGVTRSEENDNSKHIEEFSQLIRNSDDKLKSVIEELDPEGSLDMILIKEKIIEK
jgi:arylsulfatase A-like enzyme